METKFNAYIILLLFSCLSFFSCTEDVELKTISSLRNTSLLSAETITIELDQAGTLAEKIGDKKGTVENLVLSGPFNAVDVRCLREMPYLKYLDMKDVNIIGGEETYSDNYHYYENKLEDNTIGNGMFYSMESLVSVVLPSNTVKIGGEAFYKSDYADSNLESVAIPNTVKEIGYNAFRSCVKLKSISLPEEIKSIGQNAFADCQSLEQIVIPNNVKDLGYTIFANCVNLKSATVPADIVPGEGGFFNGCSNLTEIKIVGSYSSIGNSVFQGTGLRSFKIPEGVKSIGDGAFKDSKLEEVSIPNTVTSIGREAFYGTLLSSVVIPNNVTSIGANAFKNCINLSSITLSSNLSTLEGHIFENNQSLKNIIIPSSVTTIEYDVFEKSGLESLTVPSSVINIKRFGRLPNLASLIWDSSCNCEDDMVYDMPKNCLVYVSTNAAMPTSWKNVIVKGTAENISLVEGVAYNCPKDFYAKKITFTKNFAMKTGNGEAAGWETIVLPFTPTVIKDNTGATLSPFDSNVTNAKNFWLRELSDVGFKDAKTIEANKPYIIAMPNNSDYDSKYNIEGNVVFEAQNITVKATPDNLTTTSGPSFSMFPVYKTLPKANQVYVINKGQVFEGAKPGSVFVRNLRDLEPFEAYITPNGAAPRMIRIDGPVQTKSVDGNALKNKM